MKYKKESKVKGFAVGMALLLTMGAAATSLAMGVKNNGWFTSENQVDNEQPNDNDANISEVDPLLKGNRNFVSLRMKDEAVVGVSETGEQTVSKTLIATVCPKDAPNKAVDWSLEWLIAPTENADINEYLRITPKSDGALTATLTACKAFDDACAVVKVTTREGNYATTCTVGYDGQSESLGLVYKLDLGGDTDFLLIKNAFVGTIEVPEKTSTILSMDALIDDSFDLPDDEFVFEDYAEGLGTGKCRFSRSYTDKFQNVQNSDFVFDLSKGIHSSGGGTSNYFSFELSLDDFINCEVGGGIIKIDALQAIESYNSGGVSYLGPYIDPEGDGTADKCTFCLTFVSGFDEDNVDISNVATGVIYVNIIPEATGDTAEVAQP